MTPPQNTSATIQFKKKSQILFKSLKEKILMELSSRHTEHIYLEKFYRNFYKQTIKILQMSHYFLFLKFLKCAILWSQTRYSHASEQRKQQRIHFKITRATDIVSSTMFVIWIYLSHFNLTTLRWVLLAHLEYHLRL